MNYCHHVYEKLKRRVYNPEICQDIITLCAGIRSSPTVKMTSVARWEEGRRKCVRSPADILDLCVSTSATQKSRWNYDLGCTFLIVHCTNSVIEPFYNISWMLVWNDYIRPVPNFQVFMYICVSKRINWKAIHCIHFPKRVQVIDIVKGSINWNHVKGCQILQRTCPLFSFGFLRFWRLASFSSLPVVEQRIGWLAGRETWSVAVRWVSL